ncbi:hypothetical protein AQS8620_03020 [Aquimixticola soesokkakensis]|uniref:Uncharacterized protein n=1 Tax=Aquimixticola soesokkakensis TaxID=1519096 RepID=A0A1Y5TJ69_9RHOB|nr:hypothetical protein AQS8620_03020 [Aquimixticola soesokkakensis]
MRHPILQALRILTQHCPVTALPTREWLIAIPLLVLLLCA